MKITLILAVGLLLFVGCSADCQESTYAYRSRQCSIIVDEQNSSGRYITLKGRNSQTGREDEFHDQGGWYPDVYKLIGVGDTVIKRQNERVQFKLSLYCHCVVERLNLLSNQFPSLTHPAHPQIQYLLSTNQTPALTRSLQPFLHNRPVGRFNGPRSN